MNVRTITAAELDPALLARWRVLQETHPALQSPYFCPEFTQAVAMVRNDVRIAVLEDAGTVVGFLPLQVGRWGRAKPVGGPLSDFHGLIGAPELTLDLRALLKAARLSSFEFHHLVADQQAFAVYHGAQDESHYMDLSHGFDGYAEDLRMRGSQLLKDMRAKKRKLEREFGPVRFVPHSDDPRVFQQLVAWKRTQYQSSGLVDVLSFDWTVALLDHIRQIQTPTFSGMLSALYVGDDLAAVHMGMRSATVWNWWFPRHDARFAKGSPGIVLRVAAAEVAAELGVQRIDLGMGDDATYKPRLRTGGIPLVAGRIERPTLSVKLQHAYEATERWVRNSPLYHVVRLPGHVVKRLEQRWRFS